jgi:16S rRNA (cytosine967-C5)-methyltransferase
LSTRQAAHRGQRRVTPKPIPGLAARSQAADLVYGVINERRALDGAFEGKTATGDHAGADRALTQALVLTTLRRLPTLDTAIHACLDKPLHASAAKAMAILRVMAAQLLVMDMADHAAVTLAVEDAARRKDTRKLKGLINAVGRRMVREKQTLIDAAPVSDLPAWLAERWDKTYGRATAAKIALAVRDQPAIDLSLKPGMDREAWLARFADHDPMALNDVTIRLAQPGSIERLPGFDAGDWWVQDIAATLPARILLDALPDPAQAHVLDLCAAPGGKTAQLASAGCRVTALDQSAVRMKRLVANMQRLGLTVQTHIGNALAYLPDSPFDAVLLDAPCTATGTLRRNPDIGYLRRQSDILALAKVQADLLKHAAKLVKPGGVLVFATCSLEPEEGEAQITRFLREAKGWRIDPIEVDLVPEGTIRPDGTLRTLPHMAADPAGSSHGMDGFFVARLRAPA